ncbi:hypothetical protein BH09VER1_BH09VER1_36240 [soil metagenome]
MNFIFRFAVGLLAMTVFLSNWASAGSLLPSPLPPVCAPVPAPELITWLPPAPPNWQLISSAGRSILLEKYAPMTHISRVYKFVPPPVPPGETPPVVKLTKVRLALTDSAFSPGLLDRFVRADQSAGQPGSAEIKRVRGIPMIEAKRDSEENMVVFLLGGRMILTVCGNSDSKDLLAWAEHLPLEELERKISAAPRIPFRNLVYLELFVNQLNPKDNRQNRVGAPPS